MPSHLRDSACNWLRHTVWCTKREHILETHTASRNRGRRSAVQLAYVRFGDAVIVAAQPEDPHNTWLDAGEDPIRLSIAAMAMLQETQ